MKKYIFITIIVMISAVSLNCEFSFGTKQEPVLTAQAKPGTAPEKSQSPDNIAEAMKEDLSDRGWLKKKTLIYSNNNAIKDFLKKSPYKELIKPESLASVIVIPYFKKVNPEIRVRLVFHETREPFEAFALFSKIRQAPFDEYYYGERELILHRNSSVFWEGPYLISVKTYNLKKDTRDVLLGVSKGIAYKLYGLIGTYSKPEVTRLFPLFERQRHSIHIVDNDPFQISPLQVCAKACYKRDSGKSELYIFKDSSKKVVNYRKLLIAKFFIDPDTCILASSTDKSGKSYTWINSPQYGVIEIAHKDNVLAVHVGIAEYQPGLQRQPGLKDIAQSMIIHASCNRNVILKPYKKHIIISKPDSKINEVIMMGITEDVLLHAEYRE